MSEPVIAYPPELPVSAARDEIADAIRDHQVVIVAGATGSGKTTQLPKICLELGRSSIAHTQPRRLAARTIAERIADELQVDVGDAVGYKVRFTDRVSADTRIALMTDGILLNEIHRDRLLRRYDTIIIDEAHERSLNVDFLLGYLKRILPERPDLKVVITSATIDPESFARHFADSHGEPAPVIEVSGRTYPVEIRYRPLVPDAEDDDASDADDQAQAEGDEVSAIVEALRELDRETRGDVLVFLPGEAEIRDAADAVRGAYASDSSPTEVLPLYGRLSAAEQHRVFEPSRVAGVRRRVVLATNVAETSLTVPGIRYVIDAGTARMSRYSTRSKVQRLPIEPISQASAQQRSGRAGRTAPGIAIRLYSESDFERRPAFTDPEILRTSLASVILQLLALDFGDITDFPFLTPPDSRGVKAALDLLVELGAVSTRGGASTLTRTGREISRLPIDPRFARMLVEARRTGVTRDVTAIVAGLSIQDVRERPEEAREQADRMHARFTDPTSDFLSLLNLWNHLREQQSALGSSAFRRMCRTEHLNYVRVREWFDVHRQLRDLARAGDGQSRRARGERSADEPAGAADPDRIHRALLSGLLSQIGVLDARTRPQDRRAPGSSGGRGKTPRPEYLGARGIRFAVFPGSALRSRRSHAVMAGELVETSRLFARTVAAIDPAWAEPLAGDLAKRQISEPTWSKDAGSVVAYEKITLFGVEIVPRRRIQFSRVDPVGAREAFVRHALVDGDWDWSRLDQRLTAFVRANRELRRRLERVEERERRRDILVGDESVFSFYDARIPSEVVDVRSFESWWKEASTQTPRLLTMKESDLLDADERSDQRDFPSRWTQGDQTLSLAYRFEPGAPDDGVSVVVPLVLLAQLRPDGFDWQVPGLRDELITALLRALPKAIRRHVVPAADWAARFAQEIAADGPEHHGGLPADTLRAALARRIQPLANQPVAASDFDLDRVPGHLLVSFRVVDERGRVLGSGRDLAALQDEFAGRARDSVARSLSDSPRDASPRGGSGRRGRGAPGDASPSPAAVAAPASASIERSGITEWSFGDLPRQVDTKVAGGVVRGYPAIVDEGSSVAIRVETTEARATRLTAAGVRRLVLLAVPSPVGYVQEHLTSQEKLALASSPYSSARTLIEDCRVAVADAVIARTAPDGLVRTAGEFERVRDAVSAAIVDELFACVSLVARILTLAREVDRSLRSQSSLALMGPFADIRSQLDGLVRPGFVSATGTARLTHLPRYLEAARARLSALADDPGRDRQRLSEYERAAAAYAEAGGTLPPPDDAAAPIVHARWMLEEYRVSLFAQRLGTAEPVSLPRIQKVLAQS